MIKLFDRTKDVFRVEISRNDGKGPFLKLKRKTYALARDAANHFLQYNDIFKDVLPESCRRAKIIHPHGAVDILTDI